MNASEMGNALQLGLPLGSYTDLCTGFESLLSRSRRLSAGSPEASFETPPRAHGAPSLRIACATTREQLDAANELVRKRYAWRGYHVESDDVVTSRTPHERVGREITFLATRECAAIGTLTLGLDGPSGLRAEGAYRDIIERLRCAGRSVCELTRLALAESVDSSTVLASLFSLAHAVGRTLHGVTDVVIEVNPRHVGFYSRILGFAAAAGERFCERARAPSVLLQLELEALEERLRMLGVPVLLQPVAKAA